MPRISIIVLATGHALDQCAAVLARQRVTDIEVLPRGATPTGDYLVHLRPEEELTPRGLAVLMEALDASGSDLAVGTGGTGPGSVPALSAPHKATTPLAVPALLEHGESSATLWRAAFWRRHDLRWPDRPALERAFLARALLLARAVDVVPEPVTMAQAGFHEGRATRSLRTDELADVADRLETLHEVARSIGDEELRRHWETVVLEPEVRIALTSLGGADADLRTRLVERVGQVLDEAGPHFGAGAKALQRLKYHLARRRLVPELMEVVKAERAGELSLLRAVRKGRSYYGDYPFRTDRELAVPDEVYRLDRELGVRARVDDVWWEGDTLHLEGFAHLGQLDADTPRATKVRLELVRQADDAVVKLPVQRVHRQDVTADAREAGHCYDWSGFRTSVPATALRGRNGWAYGVWRLQATVSAGGVRRSRLVTATAPGRAGRPPLREVDGVRIVPTTGRGAFAVEVDTLPVIVTGLHLREDRFVVEGEVRRRLTQDGSARLLVVRPSGSTVLEVAGLPLRGTDGHRTFTAVLPLAALRGAATDEPGSEGRWALRIALPGRSRTVPLRAADGLDELRTSVEGFEVDLGRTRHGRIRVTCAAERPVVEDARWLDDILTLSGRWPAGVAGCRLLIASRDASRELALPATLSGGRFTVSFAPGAVPTLAGALPLTQGSWRLVVRRNGECADVRPLAADAVTLASLPPAHHIGAKSFHLVEDGHGLELRVGPDLFDDERGAANQYRLTTVDFPQFVASGLRDEVLFESYESRAYADNARAVLEELVRRGTGLRCRWVVVDGQTALPKGIEPVRRGSRDYYEALARSRFVVVPNYRPLHDWLQTPDEQVVVQTWHGAPFKRIALDNQRGEEFSSRDYVEMLRRESSRWNYLLSPNPTSTPILRRAFGYEGEMLETGYPRTDVFHAADRDRVAAAVRDRLGIPAGHKVVLYAPTLRDDLNYGNNRFSLDLRLDLDRAREALGDDHVLLIRRHAKVVDTVSAADGQFARDVSLWPDVNELLLATDVLVTDYSSLMFDFANTGRPMLFFTYDLADYRDRLRGFYFDASRMPGPQLASSDEVIAAIRDVDAFHGAHAGTYREFVEEFCVWDDGKASARFVDRVFAEHL